MSGEGESNLRGNRQKRNKEVEEGAKNSLAESFARKGMLIRLCTSSTRHRDENKIESSVVKLEIILAKFRCSNN